MEGAHTITDATTIQLFGMRVRLAAMLLRKRQDGVKNAALFYGRGICGVFNQKTQKCYLCYELSLNGALLEPDDVVSRFNLSSLAQAHGVALVFATAPA